MKSTLSSSVAIIASASCVSSATAFSQPTFHHRRPRPARFDACTSTTSPTSTSTSLNAFAIDFSTVLSSVDDFYRTMPFQSAFLTCSVKASMADAVAQKIDNGESADDDQHQEAITAGVAAIQENIEDDDQQQQQQFSPTRNLAYLMYGGLYTGCCQHVIYSDIFPSIFGTDSSLFTIAEEVLLDSFVVAPLLCLPVAYMTKAVVFQHSFAESMKKYVDDVKLRGLLVKYWALWIPVQTLTFSVVPEHLRIAFIALVSFFWFMILSLVGSDGDVAATDVTEEA